MNTIIDKNFLQNSCSACGFCAYKFPENFTLNTENKIEYQSNLNDQKLNELKKFCPGFGFNFNHDSYKNYSNFNYLIGPFIQSYVGHSKDSYQRKKSSSGGVTTEILIYLIKNNIVDAVYMPVIKNNSIFPSYDFVTDTDTIRENSQSIYTKIPVKKNFNQIANFKNICFVGLPDQTRAISEICKTNKVLKNKIKIKIGPMVGINMDRDVIDGIKSAFNIKEKIEILRWRHGEWPGYLYIKLSSGKEIKIKKFYYNFFLPFFCSRETLWSYDFANESADISIGDAWSPKYEKLGGGWSLIWSKTKFGHQILKQLQEKEIIRVNEISFDEAIKMHTHMLDFKKRGSIYRKKIFNFFNIKTPKDQTLNEKLYISRFIIEIIILIIIFSCRSKFGKLIIKFVNPSVLGFIFDKTRIIWKAITKKIKRKGFDKINKNVS